MTNNEKEENRPYLCTRCGFRTFAWPNTHECSGKWPETVEEYDAKDKREIENDSRMKAHIDKMNKKYE